MNQFLIGAMLLAIASARAQVTAPGLLDDPAERQVTAVTSAQLPLVPEQAGRFVRLYAERKDREEDERFYLCLFVGEKNGRAFGVTDLNVLLDEKGTERPAESRVRIGGSCTTAKLSLWEIREAAQREMTFTFQGLSSQIDVRLPSVLASNFLVACERTFGPLTNVSPQGDAISKRVKNAKKISSRGKVSFDAKATPFGEYDAAFTAAVEQCWHTLLDDHQGTHRPGKVVVDFHLTHDGRITDIKVQETQVGEILSMLCQNAILNPQPYPRWPAPMRQMFGSNSREISMTFFYYK
jgi:hypothetical protein